MPKFFCAHSCAALTMMMGRNTEVDHPEKFFTATCSSPELPRCNQAGGRYLKFPSPLQGLEESPASRLAAQQASSSRLHLQPCLMLLSSRVAAETRRCCHAAQYNRAVTTGKEAIWLCRDF